MTDDVECPPDGGDTPGMSDAFIQLSFGMADAQGTRANPNGGEDGDGLEAGQSNENSVSTAVAFLFDANVSVNGDADTHVTPVYFPTVSPSTDAGGTGINAVWETAPVQTTVENGNYNIIVVANPGDDKWWDDPANQNLGKVRDYIQQKAWKEAESSDGTISYSDFLMSSADEPTEKLTINNNSKNEPAKVTVNVERMAARVDYLADDEYTCTDPAYNDATVEITGATIVNRLTAGSYLLKRVANDVNGTNLKYLGNETETNTVATNYVLDPWTKFKTQQNLTGTPFTVNDQNVAAAGLYDAETYIPTRSDNPEDWADYCKAGDEATADDYLRVGYALENTTDRLSTSLNYNTGIVFKAQFHPVGVNGYTDGETFFTYNGTIYPTLTYMMGQLNGQENFSYYADTTVDNLTSWEELKDFAASFVNDPTGYGDYLVEYANKQTDVSAEIPISEKLNLLWDYYLLFFLGVGEDSQNGPQINLANIETRNVLFENSGEKLRTYYKGQCYYIWWLRHSNDGDEEKNGVMEYAVVRNNIYKVSVNSIYSLGGDIPDNQQLDAMVYVNKWTMLPDEVLPM